MSTRCLSSSGDVQVDDTDAGISYTGSWSPFYGPMDPSNYLEANYMSSVHVSTRSGNTASFTFNGTYIEVWGTLGQSVTSGRPNSTYSIDGAKSVDLFDAALAAHPTYYIPNVLFFLTATNLTTGSHTLVITHTGDSSSNYFLDFIRFTPSNATTVDVTPCSVSGDAVMVLTTVATVTAPFTTSFPDPTPVSVETRVVHSVSGGNISGTVIAGLAVAASLVCLAMMVLWRRQRRHAQALSLSSDKQTMFGPPSRRASTATIASADPQDHQSVSLAVTREEEDHIGPLAPSPSIYSALSQSAHPSPFPISLPAPPSSSASITRSRKIERLQRGRSPSSDLPPSYHTRAS